MSDSVRCFIALDLNEELKRQIHDAHSEIFGRSSDIRWVKTENLHITMKFLGNKKPKVIDQVSEALSALHLPQKPISVSFDRLGVFPSEKFPRIIWAGMRKSEILKEIFEQVEAALCKIGLAKEQKPFIAHVTIGRIKQHNRIKTIKDVLKQNSQTGPLEGIIPSLSFYKSTLSSRGPSYEALKHILLPINRMRILS